MHILKEKFSPSRYLQYLDIESTALDFRRAVSHHEGHLVPAVVQQQRKAHAKQHPLPLFTLHLTHLQALPVDGQRTLTTGQKMEQKNIQTKLSCNLV